MIGYSFIGLTVIIIGAYLIDIIFMWFVLPASKAQAARLREMINDTQAFPAGHYTPSFALEEKGVASQVMVMGPDDFIVSVMGY